MDLLERFRHKSPRWEDPDPAVRAEGVREEIHLEEQALLARIASGDPDARVRRAAVRKLTSVQALAASASDGDEGVREIVSETLVSLALGGDAAASTAAVEALGEARHLLTVARSAPLPEARLAALARIGDGRQLATLAKTAGDPSVRSEALRRIEDGALLADIAARTDHKGTAVAAVERIEDVEALRAIASRAVHKAASRRAQAKLDALAPPPSPVEPAAEPVVETVSEEAAPHEPAPEATRLDPAHEAIAEEPAAPASDPEPATPDPAATVAQSDAEAPSPAPSTPVPADVADAPLAQEVPPAQNVPAAAEWVSAPDEQERLRRERVTHAEALCSRLDTLTRSATVELRDAEAALREARALHDQGGLPGKLEHRLKTTRAALFARVQELREADEWSRWANAAIQEELCAKLEGLAGREDLEQVAKELHEADARWAAARQAPRDKAEALRQRYQAARAPLRSRLDAFFAKRAEEQAERLKRKQALCERAEALADSTDWLRTSDEIKGLQARWKEIGPAAPRDERLAWKRFHAACDRFFTRRQEDLKHRKDQWSANLQRKDALCVKAEALAESSDWEKAAAEVRRLQAEWKTVGPVRRSQSEAIWLRFRKACDAFFERYKKREEIEAEAKRGEREGLCRDMEAMGLEGAEVPADLAARVTEIMARARQAPTLPVADEEALTRRLVAARNRLIAAYPGAFKGTDLDPEANRQRREKLCARVEALAAEADDEPLTGEALARRLKEALAANTIGGHQEVEARRRAERAEVASAQAAWKRLGPVPGDVGASLEARFDAACARFFGAHRGAGRALSVR
jgi:hypothetical protein